ncbi:MAG: hypothetical protein PHY47_14515 [Lachnospiraceae bacterium]|nr:hypothetical protein [Lachnospiraceae bacterium]
MKVMDKDDCIILYKGESLEKAVSVKRLLDNNAITYYETEEKKDNWFYFFMHLFNVSRGSYGMGNEHKIIYVIKVNTIDADRSRALLES